MNDVFEDQGTKWIEKLKNIYYFLIKKNSYEINYKTIIPSTDNWLLC